jgi:hypothetical protein
VRRYAIHAFVFAGAVLLFSLEPMASRMLLPRFGGAFHVWTTALMFFQGGLFAGYLYAHLVAERLGRLHLAVVALPLIALPISLEGASGTGSGAILIALVRGIALPFVVLSTTAVVAQRWLASTGKEPYGLYAVSNAGSLGALLVYALFVEPFVPLGTQRWAWMIGYVAYALLAVLAWHSRGRERAAALSGGTAPDPSRMLYWALLSAAPSAFLSAVTNLIALEAGSIPLVWVVPLAVYLGSFILAFAEPREGEETRVPGLVRRLWPHVALVGVFFGTGGDVGGSGWLDAAVQVVVLGFVCLAAHGELYRARPAPAYLTRYYLVIAVGGWAGGASVAIGAPALLSGLYEYPIALGVLAATMAIARRAALASWLKTAPRLAVLLSIALVLVIAGKMFFAWQEESRETQTLAERRSFYGLYRVTRSREGGRVVRDLVSGNTRHGRQREGDLTPLSYYHPNGPLGDALALLPQPRRVGAVGLGVGAAAGHLSRGEHIRFFEIDPVVAELARAHFTYVTRSPAEVEIVIGDARVSLEREEARGSRPYTLLLVDAFSGDAIPTHLLTVEAMRLYASRLEPDGVLLLHVSNRYYELLPIIAANAREVGLSGAHVERLRDLARDQDPAEYVALARQPETLAPLLTRGWSRLSSGGRAWRDDHVNVLEALEL